MKTEFPFAENEKNERELSKKSDDGIAYLQKHESRLLLLGPLPEKKASNAKAKALASNAHSASIAKNDFII